MSELITPEEFIQSKEFIKALSDIDKGLQAVLKTISATSEVVKKYNEEIKKGADNQKKLDDNIVYRLNSNGYYKDIQVKYCGWTLTVKRLYNKKITSFNDKDEVHEHVLSNGLKEEVLKGSINHYSYHSISEFIIKADRYSTLFASNNAGKKCKLS